MAIHFTWCLKRTFLLTNRLNVYQKPVSILKVNDYVIQSRYIVNPRTTEINIDYDEPKSFGEFAEESKYNCSAATETLIKILSVARENAKKAVNDYPNFKLLTQRMIYKNFQILREAGFYKSTIKDNKYLLTDYTITLKKKISAVQQIDVDINDAAPLFHLTVNELTNFERRTKMEASYLPTRNRLVYLAEKLQCDITRVCNIMSFNPIILKLPAPKLLTITEYILDAGIAPEHVLNDMQIYNYSISTIKDNIERAKRAGVNPLKPWIVRCPKDVWKKIETRQSEREYILEPGQTVAEYLNKLFDSDVESVNFLLLKDPKLLTMDLDKLAKIAKLLCCEGYKIEDIQRAPAIMHRNYASLQKRFILWKQLCNKRPSLFIVLHNEKKFEEALEAERSKNKDEKPS